MFCKLSFPLLTAKNWWFGVGISWDEWNNVCRY